MGCLLILMGWSLISLMEQRSSMLAAPLVKLFNMILETFETTFQWSESNSDHGKGVYYVDLQKKVIRKILETTGL